jgi:hypothetical protein
MQVVPIRRLDDIPGAEAPTLIKMDVEDFEEQVLSAALAYSALLARRPVGAVHPGGSKHS